MKKVMSLVLLAAVLLCCTSCKYYVDPAEQTAVSGAEIVFENGTYGTSKPDESAFLKNGAYIGEHMPKEYFFTYNTSSETNGKKVESEISGGKSGENYYISVDGVQSLYIKFEDGFLCYTRESDDEKYKLMNDDYLLDTEAVTSQLLTASTLFGYYQNYSDVELYKQDDVEIAGRKCTNYLYDARPLGMGDYTIVFSIDPVTGVCMKTLFDLYGENASDITAYNFECTRFESEKVRLPDADTIVLPEKW